MTVAGLSAHEQHMSFTLMAGILFIGNIEFVGDEEAKVANIDRTSGGFFFCKYLEAIQQRESETKNAHTRDSEFGT